MQAEFYFKAQDEMVGIFRYYHITLMLNLFKDYSLFIAHGKIGQKARERKYFFLYPKELIKKYKQLLNKRLKAEKRIGCNYVIVEEEFDPTFADLISQKCTPLHK